MDADEFDRIESARHHVYAFYLWENGERRQARQQFLRAAALYPAASRQRRLYALYTILLPPQSVEWTSRAARWMRKLI